MKKGRLLVLAAASAAFCAAAVACGGHEHEYGAWTITADPTLTAEGSATRTCTANDGGVETVPVPALSNTEVWSSETTDATHTSAGKIVYTSVYGTVEVILPQGEHVWGKWTITKTPTATETGTAERVCSSQDGGKDSVTLPVLTDKTVWTKDTAKSTPATHTADGKDVYTSAYGTVEVVIPKSADNHDWDSWVITTKPTMTEKGTAERTCKANDGGKETKELAPLSNTLMWRKDEEKSVPATHTEEGKDVYTSAYGTVEVTIPKDETHTYGDWTITKDPTETEEGTAERVCSADQHKDTATLPVLKDTTVWTKDTEKSVSNSHTADGKDVYTSEYGEVTVVIPKSTDHVWSAWEITEAPTLTETGTAKHSCTLTGCTEQDVTATVPALQDTAVWTKNTVAPDYNNAGKDVYTSDYGTVELPGAPKLKAPYDGKTYVAFEVEVVNGIARAWKWNSDTAKVVLDETGAGFGMGAVPFRVHVSISMVNDKTGEVLITEKEVVYEDGKDPSLAVDGKISTFKGFVNMQTGVIVRAKDTAWNNFYVYIPFGWDENESEAFKCGDAFAVACGKDDTAENIFVSDDQVYFGVTFASDKAGEHEIPVAEFAENALVYVLKDNKVIASFAKDAEGAFVPADGYEGTYTLTQAGTETIYTVIVTGSGIVKLQITEPNQIIEGFYTLAGEGANYTAGAYFDFSETTTEYYEVTLDIEHMTGTIDMPMVTVTYVAGEGHTAIEDGHFNKNVAIEKNGEVDHLPAIEDTETKKFIGWFTDAEFTTQFTDESVPTEDITLYAKWSTKFVVHAIVNESDVRDIYYGVDETIGSRLPDFKIDPETNLTYVDSATNRVFVAWYTDPLMTESSALDESRHISEDDGDSITIYAKWVPAGTWSIEQEGRYHFEYDAEKGVWKSNNKGISSSSATMEIVANGDIVVTFEYASSSESTTYDYLEIRKYETKNGNNEQVDKVAEKKDFADLTWKKYQVVLTDGQTIKFTFAKDSSGNHNDDTAYIRGLKINGRPVTLSGTVDFKEGTYTSAGKDDLTLNGYGAFTWGEKAGTYSATDIESVFDMFVVAEGKQTERYTLTLSGNAYTVVENTVTISYNFGELSASLDSSTAFNGVAFTLPNAPEISGYVFRGWFDNAEFSGSAITEITPTADTVIYAKYDPAVSVTLIHNHGMADESITGKFAGDTLTLVTPQDTDSYVFRGWYDNENCTGDAITEIVLEGNTELYAKWLDKVTVTFNLNYTDAPDTETQSLGKNEICTVTAPKRNGYKFLGWFTLAEGGDEWKSGETAVSESITVYAHWAEAEVYCGTYYGVETYNASNGTGGSVLLEIDGNGMMSGKWSGTVESYDTTTKQLVVKNGDNKYYFWYEPSVNVLINSHWNTPTQSYMNIKDFFVFVKGAESGNAVKVNYAIKYGYNNGTEKFDDYWTRFLTLSQPDSTETKDILVFNDKIYTEFTVTDTSGNVVAISEIKNQTAIIVTVNGEQLFAVGTTGKNFADTANGVTTKKLDSYYGSYTAVNPEGTAYPDKVELDGVGNITFGSKVGTYTPAEEGKDYTFDVMFPNYDEWQLTIADPATKSCVMYCPPVVIPTGGSIEEADEVTFTDNAASLTGTTSERYQTYYHKFTLTENTEIALSAQESITLIGGSTSSRNYARYGVYRLVGDEVQLVSSVYSFGQSASNVLLLEAGTYLITTHCGGKVEGTYQYDAWGTFELSIYKDTHASAGTALTYTLGEEKLSDALGVNYRVDVIYQVSLQPGSYTLTMIEADPTGWSTLSLNSFNSENNKLTSLGQVTGNAKTKDFEITEAGNYYLSTYAKCKFKLEAKAAEPEGSFEGKRYEYEEEVWGETTSYTIRFTDATSGTISSYSGMEQLENESFTYVTDVEAKTVTLTISGKDDIVLTYTDTTMKFPNPCSVTSFKGLTLTLKS